MFDAGLHMACDGGAALNVFESRFPDEARWREAVSLGARGDVGELLGVEPKEFGGGAAATGGHGRSEVAGR